MTRVLLHALLIMSLSTLDSAQTVTSPRGPPSAPAAWVPPSAPAAWGPPSAPAAWGPDEELTTEATTTEWLVSTEATAAWSPPDESRTTTRSTCPNGNCTPKAGFGYCRAQDDPHLLTFDGKTYEMQKEGIFYLYKHKSNPIWVQAAFQTCGYGEAYCSCALAIRYYSEAFILYKCTRKSMTEKANIVFRTGSGNSISIRMYFSGYQVSLPNGLTVFVALYDTAVPIIDVKASNADLNQTEGLCGVFNHNEADDFIWRTGETTNINETYPYGFADSWRVPDNENLLNAPTLQNFAACTQTYETSRGPAGVADACHLNLQPDAFLSNSSQALFQTSRRRKRQNAGLGFPDGAWPVGWSYALAVTFCYKYVAMQATVNECSKMMADGVDISQNIMNCARDIYMSGGTSFSEVALTAALTSCSQQMEARGIQAPAMEDHMCPFNCSGHGACSVGACSCDSGWGGFHCSVDMTSPPSLQYSVPSSLCTRLAAGRSRCRAAFVLGAVFVNSSALAARATVYPQDEPALARDLNVGLEFITSGMIEIALRLPFCPKAFAYYNLDLSISNDGVHFSGALTIKMAAGPAKRR